jgi:hypothetical protein
MLNPQATALFRRTSGILAQLAQEITKTQTPGRQGHYVLYGDAKCFFAYSTEVASYRPSGA